MAKISPTVRPSKRMTDLSQRLHHCHPLDTCETMQFANDQVISCSLSKQEHDAFIQETSALSSSSSDLAPWRWIWSFFSFYLLCWYMAYIMDTNEERVKTKNATRLVAPTIAASLGALTHTLGTLIPVIGASGFATVAAATAIGTVVGSFR